MNTQMKLLALTAILTFPVASSFADDASTSSAAPSDPEIAHIVVTANQIDVDAGHFVKKKTHDRDVKAFAQEMITDHSSMNQQAKALAKKLHVTPKDNPTSDTMKSGAKDEMAKLKHLKGKDFDKEYVDHEVEFHQTVLDSIDNTLIPNAKNEELKNLIVKVRPTIEAHLEHAKSLKSKLAGQG